MKKESGMVGRKAYIDWGDKIIAITVYKKGYTPERCQFTKDNKGHNIPRLADVVNIIGEEKEMNQQDSAMRFHYGRDIADYLLYVMQGKEDEDRIKEDKQ